MKRRLVSSIVIAALAAVPSAAAHELDHPAPSFSGGAPLPPGVNAGGPGARWELVDSFGTGNPHTDLDFFTKGGDVYASVGTLAVGPNGAGQTIVRLTQGGRIAPSFVAGHPSAECPSNPADALGLQHDVEAAPKGQAILNTPNPAAVTRDTQLLIDASDAPGRCHDNGVYSLGAPQGGLELIDVTSPSDPKEIALTSHIGEAHTVNVDPKRPHIAYAVTSDSVGVDQPGNRRRNENPASADRLDLDGFEVVDMSSCMDFPPGTTLEQKRDRCRPQVYRYRYPSALMSLGHTVKSGGSAVNGCHELEIYPNDRLTCGSIGAGMVFDMSGAFDDRGTPNDFSDDRPRGTPLPCERRPSTSLPPFGTDAMVTDCVIGTRGGSPVELDVPGWLAIGAPSLQGVRFLGSAFHQGRGGPHDSTQDIDVNHEFELTESRRFLLATDERGGGVTPPGATCASGVDNTQGNGGIHAFRPDRLLGSSPDGPDRAWTSYARNSRGAKAIYRATPRTGAEPTLCTAHVFQQIPGQNRIFMGWYSQGTQVVDFVEHANGTIDFKEAGWLIPTNANTWVSHIFKFQRNADGTYTYWGATGDFQLGVRGRNAIDIYRVTLPPPPRPLTTTSQPRPRPRTRRLRMIVRPRSTRVRRRTCFTFRVTTGGRRLRGVRVRFAGSVRRTNRRGRARICKRFRRAGRRRAIATRRGYRSARTSVLVRRARARPRFTG